MQTTQQQTFQHRLLSWYAQHRRDLPWRHTRDPYAILVAEVMLQQTQVDRVIPKYTQFLEWFPDWETLAEASPGNVIRAWAPLGYNRRAVRLQAIARQVVERYAGLLPQEPHALERLEGIGPYTAAAVACFAFGLQVATLDTNVQRVLGRLLFGPQAISQRDLRTAAEATVQALQPGQAPSWNQALMDLGATICIRRPRCAICPLHQECRAAPYFQQPQSNLVAEESAKYQTRQPPFRDSTRYYRGRIVQRLRALPEGKTMALATLGAELRDDFTQKALPWLHRLVAELHREGLVYAQGLDGTDSEEDLARVRVRLP